MENIERMPIKLGFPQVWPLGRWLPEGLVQDEVECELRREETLGPEYHREVPVLLPVVAF